MLQKVKKLKEDYNEFVEKQDVLLTAITYTVSILAIIAIVALVFVFYFNSMPFCAGAVGMLAGAGIFVVLPDATHPYIPMGIALAVAGYIGVMVNGIELYSPYGIIVSAISIVFGIILAIVTMKKG